MSSTVETNTLKSSAVPHTPEPNAEPGPDWNIAKEKWNFAWELHWLGFGLLFSLVSLHSLVALVRLKRRKVYSRPPLFIAVNALLGILGFTRAIYLFVDPYESGEHHIRFPRWLSRLLFGLAYPCLSSSFCFVHLAFLEVTKLKLGSSRLHSPRFLGLVVTAHFILVFVAEITSAIKPSSGKLLIVCQSFFILWGLLLSVSFIYSGTKVIREAAKTRKQLTSIGEKEERSSRVRPGKSNMSKVAKITLATSVLGLGCCALQIYSLVGVYGLYSTTVNPEPWPWWIFQTGFRLTELAMACTIAYSVMQPADRGRKGQQHLRMCVRRRDSN